MPSSISILFPFALLLSVGIVVGTVGAGYGAPAGSLKLAVTPPMSWSAWAHYQCGYTAETILDNARELVKTGLAGNGYTLEGNLISRFDSQCLCVAGPKQGLKTSRCGRAATIFQTRSGRCQIESWPDSFSRVSIAHV